MTIVDRPPGCEILLVVRSELYTTASASNKIPQAVSNEGSTFPFCAYGSTLGSCCLTASCTML